jgi:hypothetical protein
LTGGTRRRGGRLAAEGAGPNEVAVQVYLREGEAEGHPQAQRAQEALQGAAYEGGEVGAYPGAGVLRQGWVRKPCD